MRDMVIYVYLILLPLHIYFQWLLLADVCNDAVKVQRAGPGSWNNTHKINLSVCF